MSLDIKAMVIIFIYAILSNMILINIAKTTDSVVCENIQEINYNYTYEGNYTQDEPTKESGVNLIKLALNRCVGIPFWIFWLTQMPTIIGILYLIRGFIGFT